MTEQPPSVANANLDVGVSYPKCLVEAFRMGLIDTGILIKVKIPFIVNTSRRWNSARSEPLSDRQPFFGILVDPYINHDLGGPYSPLVYPDPVWAAQNVVLTAYPYGREHPFVKMMRTFTGWRGSLNYLITVNSSMIVQGELAVMRGRYVAGGKYIWKYLQLESDEPDNNQIINLATERRVAKISAYNENVDFVNSLHYWQTTTRTPTPNYKPVTALRNYIFVRPNTDITTFTTEEAFLTFKIFIEPGPDFEFLYPSLPGLFDTMKDYSVIDPFFPFLIRNTLVVAQVGHSDIPIKVDFTYTNQTYEWLITEERMETIPVADPRGFLDSIKYIPDSTAAFWEFMDSIIFGTEGDQFVVTVVITGPRAGSYTVYHHDKHTLVRNTLMVDFGSNVGVYDEISPPYLYA